MAFINFSVDLHTGNRYKLDFSIGLLGLVLLLKTHLGGRVNNKRRLFERGVYFPQPANNCGDYSRVAFI